MTKKQELQTVPDVPTSMLEVIQRVALDPNVDVEKMERLMALQERILDRNAKAAFDDALAKMQPMLPVIQERGAVTNRDGVVQSTYATWKDVNAAIKPVLKKHRFSLRFRTGVEGTMLLVTGILSHAGHSEETTLAMPADTSGNKNAVQAVMSTTSYGKRGTTMLLLNLSTTLEEDDDAATACKEELIDPDQKDVLIRQMQEVGADTARFLNAMEIDSLDALPSSRYAEALAAIDAKRRQNRKDGGQP